MFAPTDPFLLLHDQKQAKYSIYIFMIYSSYNDQSPLMWNPCRIIWALCKIVSEWTKEQQQKAQGQLYPSITNAGVFNISNLRVSEPPSHTTQCHGPSLCARWAGGSGLKLDQKPLVATWDMRAGLEFWLLTKSQNVLEQLPAAKVNTGQSGFIYCVCLSLHVSTGTSELPKRVCSFI